MKTILLAPDGSPSAQLATDEAGVTATFDLREGFPAEEICAAATETASTLIVQARSERGVAGAAA